MVKSALRLLTTTILIASLTSSLPLASHAQPSGACNEKFAMQEGLLEHYNETRRWSGVSADGKVLTTLYFDKDSWTLVQTDEQPLPDGTTYLRSCMVGSGSYSVTYSPITEDEEEF